MRQPPSLPLRSLRAAALLVLLLALAACGTHEPVPGEPAPETPAHAPAPQRDAPWGAGVERAIPEPEALRPGARSLELAPMAVEGDAVRLAALVIGATRDDPALAAWEALLDQAGVPHEVLVATEEELTSDRLVDDDVGRFQAILLATNNLSYATEGGYESAFTEAEWDLLHAYERDFDVRQVAFYAFPGVLPESHGVEPLADGAAAPEGYALRPTAAGLELFDDLAADAEIPVRNVWTYPSRLAAGSDAVPLLQDGSGHVLAVASTSADGRERVALLFDQGAYGGTPLLHTQLLGPDLIRWATKGVHLGERRLHLGADIDDWFVPTAWWDVEAGDFADEEFELTAADAFSFRDQQQALRDRHPHAADFTWTMAYNGSGADPDAACLPAGTPGVTLSDATMCLAEDFWWVNHTWSHAYMDRNPPAYDIGYDAILDEIERNDAIAERFGFGDAAPASLVTGDISGLGWYSPGGPDTGPKVDHGLTDSNPDLLAAAADTGRRYIASNMSTASHEPDCGGCGTEHPLDERILLVPRWPTNVFAAVGTPEAAVQAYNQVYGPGGTEPYYDDDLDYEAYLDADTETALVHVLSGSPYPHYFHIANLHEYAPGRSLLTDWADVLLGKVAGYVDLPVRTLPWDELGAYVEDRTSFAASGASGVWDRAAGTLTIDAPNGGTVLLTGASLGAGTTEPYGDTVVARRVLEAGERVTVDLDAGDPPADDDPPPPATYELSVTIEGEGRVTGAGAYDDGATATLVADPADGWRFGGWSGDASGDALTVDVVMDGDRSVGARFLEVVDPDPGEEPGEDPGEEPGEDPGDAPDEDPSEEPGDEPGEGPGEDPGSDPGEEPGEDPDEGPGEDPVPGADPPATRVLAVGTAGDGFGVIIATPGGLACTGACEGAYEEGTLVTLVPVPTFGSAFAGWSGTCEGDGGCAIEIGGDASVVARFEAAP